MTEPLAFVPTTCSRCSCPEFILSEVNIIDLTAIVSCVDHGHRHVVRIEDNQRAWAESLTNEDHYRALGVLTLPAPMPPAYPRRTRQRARIVLH